MGDGTEFDFKAYERKSRIADKRMQKHLLRIREQLAGLAANPTVLNQIFETHRPRRRTSGPDRRIGRDLPANAPAIAREAVTALQILDRIAAGLSKTTGWPGPTYHVIQIAVELGIAMQRVETLRLTPFLGNHVRREAALSRSRRLSAESRSRDRQIRYEEISIQFGTWCSCQKKPVGHSPTKLRKLFAKEIGLSEATVRRAIKGN